MPKEAIEKMLNNETTDSGEQTSKWNVNQW
jgi:hypothetical protein